MASLAFISKRRLRDSAADSLSMVEMWLRDAEIGKGWGQIVTPLA